MKQTVYFADPVFLKIAFIELFDLLLFQGYNLVSVILGVKIFCLDDPASIIDVKL
ncbi:hypothetical protein [Prosthecochloris sp.]|uniref:hypothetical protein n=1 Tax=Prosthecochloris sp. TaxID=290513 RepID=UPI002580AE7C|nr:hypothetical protein [Prosthecochloris sp.]